MKIIEAGHIYELEEVKTNAAAGPNYIHESSGNIIKYVNNEGPKFYNGTQSQELLRVLIDRTMHCDNCLRWSTNDKIIFHLRMALVLHEARALERRVEKGKLLVENIKLADNGHFSLEGIGLQSIDAEIYHTKEK